jgi:hypothetical protein
MPGDPVFDEGHIIELLSIPASVDNIDDLQSGVVQTLCDLYDRKVTRDEFIGGAAVVLQCYGQLAKFWLLDHINGLYLSGVLTPEKFSTAYEQSRAVITEQKRQLANLVARLKECPTSKDPIS